MSDLARNIIETVFCFSKTKGNITHDTIDIQDGVPIHIKDITITRLYTRPLGIPEHSGFLIEADGKRVWHTGDFRRTLI